MSVRTTSGTPACAAATMPRRSGRSDAWCRRAPRTTTAVSTAAIAHWVITVPSADPAMPSPTPYTSTRLRATLTDGAGHEHHQRRSGVLEPAEHAGRGEHDQHRGDAGGRDPEERLGERRDRRRGTEGVHDLWREQRGRAGRDDADQHGEPEPVDALGERGAQVAGTELAGDRCRGPVREEDAEVDDGREGGAGDAERGQRRRAEVTDDRGVGEQEQRLGDQCAERGEGEAQDLAVVRAAPGPAGVGCLLRVPSWGRVSAAAGRLSAVGARVAGAPRRGAPRLAGETQIFLASTGGEDVCAGQSAVCATDLSTDSPGLSTSPPHGWSGLSPGATQGV